ncbi:MAG: hypothetical protein WC256_03565 [Desulfurivibrionaceae bacterium]|jgi:hypothetical protein
MSDSITTTLHEYVIMAFGVPATPELLEALRGLYGSTGDYTVVDTVVNNYMNNQVATTANGAYGLVQMVAQNGLGVTLNNAQAMELTNLLVANGIDSWSKLFSLCSGLDNELGVTLSNRAAAAESFCNALDTTAEITAYATPTGRATVAGWLAGVTHDPATLARARTGMDSTMHTMFNPTTGSAQDGYLSGARVFSDLDRDGIQDSGEPSTITDSAGNFILPAGSYGPIIATGGTDVLTGLPFRGAFTAPAGSTVVNPLTTLMASLVEQGHTLAEANSAVLAALGLELDDPTLTLATFDPLANLSGANAVAARQVLAGCGCFSQQYLHRGRLGPGRGQHPAHLFPGVCRGGGCSGHADR